MDTIIRTAAIILIVKYRSKNLFYRAAKNTVYLMKVPLMKKRLLNLQ